MTSEPVNFDGFTWERADCFQCVAGVKYTVPEQCDERTYFTKHGANAICAANTDGQTPKPLILQKAAEVIGPTRADQEKLEDILCLRSVEYGQLNKKYQAPDLSKREPPANTTAYVPADLFETFDVEIEERDRGATKKAIKKYVQAPECEGGWFAEITGDIALKFRVALEFEIIIDDWGKNETGGDDGAPATASRAPKNHATDCDFSVHSAHVRMPPRVWQSHEVQRLRAWDV